MCLTYQDIYYLLHQDIEVRLNPFNTMQHFLNEKYYYTWDTYFSTKYQII